MFDRLARPLPFLLLVLLPASAIYIWGIDWGLPMPWAYDEITPRNIYT